MKNITKIMIGLMLLILVTFLSSIVSYSMQMKFKKNIFLIRDVEFKIHVLASRVGKYDAMLSEAATFAVLHADVGDSINARRYRDKYDVVSDSLDNLLKRDFEILLAQSIRAPSVHEKTNSYLNEVDQVNTKLVAIEAQMFQELEEGNIDRAKELITSREYIKQKEALATVLKKWSQLEDTHIYMKSDEAIYNTKYLILANIISSLVITVIVMITLVRLRVYLVEKAVHKKH